MKKKIITTSILLIILIISALAAFFASWNIAVKILMLCMLADYLIGISLAIIGKSKKGTLKSTINYTGIVKKTVMLFIVAITGLLQKLLQVDNFQQVVTVAFIGNELLSIAEHAQVLGIPVVNIMTTLKKYKKEENTTDDKKSIK